MAEKVPFLHAAKTIMVDYVDETPDYRVGVIVLECSEEERLKNRARLMEVCYDIIRKGQFANVEQ